MSENIKEILDMLKTDMIHIRLFKEDRDKLLDYITNLQNKLQQKENIINELEKWLKEQRDYYYENYYYSDFNAYGSKCDDVLDKLKELKENK